MFYRQALCRKHLMRRSLFSRKFCAGIEGVAFGVNLKRYPINQRQSKEYDELVKHAQLCLEKSGCFRLPGFLTSDAIEKAQKECLSIVEQDDIVGNQVGRSVNCFYSECDESLPSTHPINTLFARRFGAIRDDMFGENSVLRGVYDDQTVLRFVADVLQVPELYQSRDRYQALTVNVLGADDSIHWHFDNNDFALTLGIQMPEGGGELEYVADVGQCDMDAIKDILSDDYHRSQTTRGNQQVGIECSKINNHSNTTTKISKEALFTKKGLVSHQYDTEEGTLVFFRGGQSIHRVRPVLGKTLRMVAALQYHTLDGAFDGAAKINRIYGIKEQDYLGPKTTISSTRGKVDYVENT